MDEFYEQGGPTSFIDRVSAALGIHASQMKVVAVYTGSVVVEYEIEAEDDEDDDTDSSSSSSAAAQLRAIETSLNELVSGEAAAEVFGAPVLSASNNGAVIVEDPTYNPALKPTDATTPVEEDEEEKIVIEVSAASGAGLIGVFVVLVLVVVCCFACGVAVVCAYSISKASKEVLTV